MFPGFCSIPWYLVELSCLVCSDDVACHIYIICIAIIVSANVKLIHLVLPILWKMDVIIKDLKFNLFSFSFRWIHLLFWKIILFPFLWHYLGTPHSLLMQSWIVQGLSKVLLSCCQSKDQWKFAPHRSKGLLSWR